LDNIEYGLLFIVAIEIADGVDEQVKGAEPVARGVLKVAEGIEVVELYDPTQHQQPKAYSRIIEREGEGKCQQTAT
jgi:hypothetical protein